MREVTPGNLRDYLRQQKIPEIGIQIGCTGPGDELGDPLKGRQNESIGPVLIGRLNFSRSWQACGMMGWCAVMSSAHPGKFGR